jgi:hypothetical protein
MRGFEHFRTNLRHKSLLLALLALRIMPRRRLRGARASGR